MSIKVFTLILSLMLTAAAVIGCSSQGTVYTRTPTPTTEPTTSTLAAASNQSVAAGKSLDMPSGGVPVKRGHVLTLTWSADGALECHILTANQYNQYVSFRQSGKQSGSSSSALATGTITLTVTSDDTFYAVLINISTVGSSVQVYQATLTEQ